MYKDITTRSKVKDSSSAAERIGADTKNLTGSILPGIVLSFMALATGSIFQQIATNDTLVPVVALSFLLMGIVLVRLLAGNRYEFRTFILSFSICIFVSGLAQLYSLHYFGSLMSTIDANVFLNIIHDDSYTTLEQLGEVVNAPLPVLMWKKLADIRDLLGLGDGPAIFMISNAFVVAMAGVFVTKVTNYISESDENALKRVGTLYAFCGLFLLFGALLLRDGYALLINILAVWALVRALLRPNLLNLLIVIITLSISGILMLYIREKAFFLFFLFGLMAFFIWYIKSSFSPTKIIFFLVIMGGGIFLYEEVDSQTTAATDATSQKRESYTSGAATRARPDSLGMALVVDQPMPIRLVVGSLYLLIIPIPAWGYFQVGNQEYHLIKGWHAIFLISIMPSVIYSTIAILRKKERLKENSGARMFLLLYAIVTLVLTVMTTLETRHLGQFLPAIIILAAMQKINSFGDKPVFIKISLMWFCLIAVIHILWAILKFSKV